MRILYVGELEPHARSHQRLETLREMGHDVTGVSLIPFGWQPGLGVTPLWDRIAFKLGRPRDSVGANRALLAHCRSTQWNLVWIEKGLTIRPQTLRMAKHLQATAVLVSYAEDDMFARHNQSAYYRADLPIYDIVFSTKSYNCEPRELASLGAKRVVFVDKAYDRRVHRPMTVTPRMTEDFGGDVGFVGSFEESRARKLLHLAESGFAVRVWGNGWKNWVGRHPCLRVENRPLYGDDYVGALCSTKINLCFLRKANRDLQTDRTMEIPACGAFMLAERTHEHERLFRDNEEAVFFRVESDYELVEKVRYYLSHDAERDRIAQNGRDRCVASGYSHHDRLAFMLQQSSLTP